MSMTSRLLASLRHSPVSNDVTIGKRKRSPPVGDIARKVPKPKKKKKKNKKNGINEDENLDLADGVNNAIMMMDSRLLADYFTQRTRRFSSDPTFVELQDQHIPGK